MAARARPASRRRSLAMHVAQQARPWWSRSHSRTRLSVMLCVIVTGPSPRLSCGECSTPVATRRSTPRGRAGRRLRRRLRAPPRWALLRRGRLGKGGRSLDGTWRRHGWRVGGLLTIGRLSAASVHRRRRRKLPIGPLLGPARARCIHQAFLVYLDTSAQRGRSCVMTGGSTERRRRFACRTDLLSSTVG